MQKKILITGGAGFIGTNAAKYYLNKDYSVIILDNLSRIGAKENLSWIQTQGKINLELVDIKNRELVRSTIKKWQPELILHLAAQVTMVDSITNPENDFDTNALGTFNVLDAVRLESPHSKLIFSSTNKVYGEMIETPVLEKEERYAYENILGINEKQKLDFHGPYGCSKGAGDQYTLDFSRIYGINTVVFRQSGIYGTRQFGIEEQGWLAWFSNALLFNKPVTIFGDGKQVRDVLYIDDLLRAYDAAFEKMEQIKGNAYNIGGGTHSLSILELINTLEKLSGKKIEYSFGKWRQGDQKIYISDISKAKKEFNWSPEINPAEGVEKLLNWISQNLSLIESAGVFKK